MKNKIERSWENSLAYRWVRNHKKEHVIDLVDLNHHLDVHIKASKLSFWVGTTVAVAATGFFGIWLMRMPEQLNLESGFAISVLIAMLWFIARSWMKTQIFSRNFDAFTSVEQYLMDMEGFEILKQNLEHTSEYLHGLGTEISTSDRRHGPESSSSKSLRKKFKRIHGTLISFGLCNKDWGHYIPNLKEQTQEGGIMRLYAREPY